MKKILFVLTLLSVLILAGCGQSSEGDVAVDERVKTGTRGMQMEFIRDIPYNNEAYEQEQFPLALTIRNEGGYDITQGWLAMTTEGPVDVLSVERSGTVYQFATPNDPLGGKGFGETGQSRRIEANLRANEIALTKEQQATITTKACYQYQTTLVQKICIDPDINQEFLRIKPCKYKKDTGISGGQGAPVSVTNVEFKRIPYGNNIQPVFKLTVTNNEGGKIIEEGNTGGACSTGIIAGAFNKIKAEAKIGDERLSCIQKDEDSQIYIECTGSQISQSKTSGYKDIVVDLYYGYIIEDEKNIRLLKKE